MTDKYDVIVVGGGHAGCEAAHAAAQMGSRTLLVTMNLETIGQMSCNPAMGGIAKGQIVREIDALGGMSGIISDETMVQFRMLNMKKGPAMWSPRVQSDRWMFARKWRITLEQNKNVDFLQDMAVELLTKGGRIEGVKTSLGNVVHGQTVILTSGTFLNGVIHIGEQQFGGGRAGERASKGITESLNELGFDSGRMKTGTPPRVDGRSLDYSKFTEQKGDDVIKPFSYVPTHIPKKQLSCWISYTSVEVHDILRTGFEKSPMFTGRIGGVGPRYCPSIEDKIERFADKDRHQLFIEPEGWDTVEMYINGFSTSLPAEVQYKALSSISGFEDVKFLRPGYAIEYDYFPPIQLKKTLETKLVDGLFFAGQINGTTGYEEAGAQGLMAGINASLQHQGKDAFVLGRDEAYIGVLIDDLITKGTEEPYRMFTSRAEYRILLRQDNADARLTERGYAIGLVTEERMEIYRKKREAVDQLIKRTKALTVDPADVNPYLDEIGSKGLNQKVKADKIVQRPGVLLEQVLSITDSLNDELEDVVEQAELHIKYSGYINRERENVLKTKRLEGMKIPEDFDFMKIYGMSTESRLKLTEIRPETVGEASRVSGVSPNDISVLLVFLGR